MTLILAVTEDLSPGPDGKLISTMERMHIIQQQQVEPETKPEEVEKPKPEGNLYLLLYYITLPCKRLFLFKQTVMTYHMITLVTPSFVSLCACTNW